MPYIFESKRDHLYIKNRDVLCEVIERAGGDGDRVVAAIAEELLDTLARNSIELEAKYTGERNNNDN